MARWAQREIYQILCRASLRPGSSGVGEGEWPAELIHSPFWRSDHVLPALAPIASSFKANLSADRFRAGPMELVGKWSTAVAANEFDPDLFTCILKDQLFEDYLAMVIQLHEATKRLSQIAGEWPCHEQETRCEDHKRLRTLLGRQHMRCPMRGRVLPELVVDGWASLLVPYDLPGHNVEQGMLLAAGCSEGKVHSDFQRGMSFSECMLPNSTLSGSDLVWAGQGRYNKSRLTRLWMMQIGQADGSIIIKTTSLLGKERGANYCDMALGALKLASVAGSLQGRPCWHV